jgi:hypothetical protein
MKRKSSPPAKLDPAFYTRLAKQAGLKDTSLPFEGLPPDASKKPEWKYWQSPRRVKPWEAAALSLELDPFAVTYEDREKKFLYWRSGELISRFKLIIHDLESCRETVGVPIHERTLEIAEFSRWAISIGWEVPAMLKRYAKASPAPRAANGWPWGQFNTKLLEDLAAAAKEFWATWDGEQGTAPKTDAVVKWLMDKRGLSQNIASAIATILRADSLPSGPRKKAKQQKG